MRKEIEVYLSRWGLSPSFKAVLHSGKVVAGEIGDFKSQFVFHGEALHQLSLMEKYCRSIGVPVLLSKSYVDLADLPAYYQLRQCSELNTSASTDSILLFTVQQSIYSQSIPD